jgi:flagellar hook-associated protein 2
MVTATSGTSIDVNSLVSQIMAAERSPLAAIQKAATNYQTEISAYGQLRSGVAGLGDALTALDNGSIFSAATATVSDAGIATASAANGALPGTYNVEVQTLAQAQKLASAAFAAADAPVGTGTLSIQLGTWTAATSSFAPNAAKSALSITVDASNNTLAGVRDAINGANGGVRASIINDGSGFRLALSSLEGGTANSLRIGVTDADGADTDTSGLSRLAYDPAAAAGAGKNLTQNAAAQDAVLFIDGVRVVKSSNLVTDAISGVTLNLAKTNAGGSIAVTVAPDAAAMKTALEAFVKAYNGLNSTVRSLTFYDAANKRGGTLQGDAAARGVASQLRSLLTGTITGLSGDLTRLPQLGLTQQTDGSLVLDGAKFQAAVSANPGALTRLFSTAGRTTDTRVTYQGANATTATGTFAVAISQPATRGGLAGSNAAGLTITGGANDTLSLSIDGVAASVTLAAGTYASAADLAAELQYRLNGNAALKAGGIQATVSESGGILSVVSNGYGSGSSVTVPGGNAAAGLFGGAPAATAGQDVAGTINGVAATGQGQSLRSADGLRLKVTATSAGALGTLAFTRGYGSLLKDAANKLIDTTGPIAARTDGLAASVKRNTRQQEDFNARMASLEIAYRRQFSALDSMLTRMGQTSSYLSQQLAALARNN